MTEITSGNWSFKDPEADAPGHLARIAEIEQNIALAQECIDDDDLTTEELEAAENAIAELRNLLPKERGQLIENGDVILGGNFTQHTPGTEIMKGYQLTIRGGNFGNVKKQPGWKIEGGNWRQIERCSHVHPGWVKHGLPKCPDDCPHRSATKEWVEISVAEFRAARSSLDARDVEIDETPDSDGVRKQVFKKFVHTYDDKGID